MKTKNITIIAVTIALLVLVYALLKLDKSSRPVQEEQKNNLEVATTTKNQETISYINYNSTDKSQVPVLKFKEGVKVKLSITSDIIDEAHLHGYDISVEVSKNTPGILEFEAKKSGRFPIELEKNGKEIAVVEIYPN